MSGDELRVTTAHLSDLAARHDGAAAAVTTTHGRAALDTQVRPA